MIGGEVVVVIRVWAEVEVVLGWFGLNFCGVELVMVSLIAHW